MKFVCDNCKAKYQIGDDKVAGKTVRMKCRKCGYNIKVTPADQEQHDTRPDTTELETASPITFAPVETFAAPPAPVVSHAPAASHAPVAPHAPAASHALAAPRPATIAPASAPPRPSAGTAPPRPAPAAAPRPATAAPRPVTTTTHARPVGSAGSAGVAPRPVTTTAGALRPAATTTGAPRPQDHEVASASRVGLDPALASAAARTAARQAITHAPASVHAREAAPIAPPPARIVEVPADPITPEDEEGEWYVGIAGTPIGPVGVVTLRARAAAREIDGDSLVWREGMAEWRPLSSVPELRDAVLATRAAPVAPAPPAPPPAPPARALRPAATPRPAELESPRVAPIERTPMPVAPSPIAGAPFAATPFAATPFAPAPFAAASIERSPVPAAAAPFAAAPAPIVAPSRSSAPPAAHAVAAFAPAPMIEVETVRAIAPDAPRVRADVSPAPAPTAPRADISPVPAQAAVRPSVSPAPAPVAPAAPLHVIDAFAPAPASNGKANGANGIHHAPVVAADVHARAPIAADAPPVAKNTADAEEDRALAERLVPRRSSGPHPMAYAFIAAAAAFGGVAAYVVLGKPQTQIVTVQVPAPPSAAAPTATAPDKGEGQLEVGEISTVAPTSTAAKPASGSKGRPAPSTTSSPSNAAPLDTGGIMNNVPGPAATAPGGSQAGSGGQLSQGEISGVVAQNQALVKRKCWQPALEARAANGPMNARVNGSIVISASGAVESANASGAERDFPGLAACIAGRMKGWKFPPSSGSTPVNVPFVFAGQ